MFKKIKIVIYKDKILNKVIKNKIIMNLIVKMTMIMMMIMTMIVMRMMIVQLIQKLWKNFNKNIELYQFIYFLIIYIMYLYSILHLLFFYKSEFILKNILFFIQYLILSFLICKKL